MNKPRARDLGIPFDGTPGAHNAITDVAGVTVGHTTLISHFPRGHAALVISGGPTTVRTGVTAILPRGSNAEPVFGAWHTLNGCGEMTGTTWLAESGILAGPVMLTNTMSVGVVADAVADWWYGVPRPHSCCRSLRDLRWLPERHLRAARPEQHAGCARRRGLRPDAEGQRRRRDGHDLSRIQGRHRYGLAPACRRGWQRLHARRAPRIREQLTIAEAPVGAEITDLLPARSLPRPICRPARSSRWSRPTARSCPTSSAGWRNVGLGIGQRRGGLGENSSGDIFIAFSTAPLAAESAGACGRSGCWRTTG